MASLWPVARCALLALLLALVANWGPAAAQYRPEWPSKAVQQEIFLLNLEDGYFGCQVNESQDFLQLFELSRLCDGQPQCYLGTDEMTEPLKCRSRERCSAPAGSSASGLRAAPSSPATSGANHEEVVQCVNGVCLDGLCYCNDGFGGKSCDVPDENECKFRPCDVFAHCTNTMGSYYCSCFPGYDGDGMHCQDINECEIPSLAALCSDNSECCNLPGHFVCKCRPGYQQSGASQSALSGAPTGNTSVVCTDIDECLDERACGRGANCENLPGSFRCSCPAGFTGDPAVECTDMDECRNSPCGPGAQCTNVPGGYRCACAAGFERPAEALNSSACVDVNECNRSPCGPGAQCINTQGAYYCQCPPNYTGNPKLACTDIDECAAHVCGPNSLCSNSPGGYKCECKPGYTGNAYSPDGCQDEDECLSRKEACGELAQCFNTAGSFQCSCPSGFTGDPYARCSDIDECAAGSRGPCGPGAQCVNLAGGYRCACPDKYLARSGAPELGCERAAIDIGCSDESECTRNAHCVNSTCQCKAGFGASGIDCVDVDECAIASLAAAKPFTKLSSASLGAGNGSHPMCGPEAECRNTEGSFACDCKPGYEKLPPGGPMARCRDVNECEASTSGPCGPNSRCFNTDGGFKCDCSDGFVQAEAGEPSAGCKSPCEGVNCGQHATCKPHGEEAACVCKPGFTFDPNNIKLGCVDINECDTNYGPAGLCGQRAQCTNVAGSYRCSCPTGFTGDAYRYCEDVNECDRRFGVFGQCGELAVCNNTLGGFSCTCGPGYTGDARQRCQDIDECQSGAHRCAPNALCSNTPGKYACRCPPGYTGDPHKRCQPERRACSTSGDCGPNEQCRSGACQCPYGSPADATTAADEASAAAGSGQPCRHPCERTECGAHATCQLANDNSPLCVCDAGFMAPSDGRSGCVDVNECIVGVALSGVSPVGVGGRPAGAVAAGTNGSHPCGRNALCRNQPGSFDCVCPAGFAGNPYEACQLEVRNQQQLLEPSTTTAAGSGLAGSATPNQVIQQVLATQTTNQSSSVSTVYSSTTTSTGSGGPQNNNNNNNNNTGSTQAANSFGNYVQEARTSACADTCSRGQVCAPWGRCVRPDACRNSADCAPSDLCERLEAPLGSQCVNACERAPRCGPEAQCAASAHRAACVCNHNTSGDPYDLVRGCQRPKPTATPPQQPEQPEVGGHDAHRVTAASGGFELGAAGQQAAPTSGQHQPPAGRRPGEGLPSQPLLAYETTAPPAPTDELARAGNRLDGPREPSKQFDDSTGSHFPAATTVNNNSQQLANNRSSMSSTLSSTSRSCTSDQHCPGNLFCLDELGTGRRLCSCPPGYKRDWDYCYLTRVNCSSSAACKPREKCLLAASGLDVVGPQQLPGQQQQTGAICVCPRGYKLTQSGVACIDRNECDEGAPCAVGAVCQNRIGSYECVCPPGTLGEPYTKTCEPIGATGSEAGLRQQQEQQTSMGGECRSNSDCASDRECDLAARSCVSPCHVCGPRALCTASNHAAICLCPPRFTGSAIDLVYGCQEPAYTFATPTLAPTTSSSTGPASSWASGASSSSSSSSSASSASSPLSSPPSSSPSFHSATANSPSSPQSPTAAYNTGQVGQVSLNQQPDKALLAQPPPPHQPTQAPNLDTPTTAELVEFRTIPPSELFVMCMADGIQVELQLGGFDGIIYVKGHSQDPKCRKLVSSSSGATQSFANGTSGGPADVVDFKVQFGHCDLIHRDGEAGFVLVIQKHPKLVTYRARAYHVKCVYNTGERTVSLGFNVSMITTSGTIANTGPPPTCLMSITALDGREVSSAEIGQDLLLRVDVQPDSIYGGFARSCEAKTMDDEGEYQYEVTDANGCATDASIFSEWRYDADRKSLVARFNAFKFPSSNNLRFQCNVRVCFGSCPPVNCNGVDAYGRRRRRRRRALADDDDDTSGEPLGYGGYSTGELAANANATALREPQDGAPEVSEADAFKEGALREEITVQSNAILTFDRQDKRPRSAGQQRPRLPLSAADPEAPQWASGRPGDERPAAGDQAGLNSSHNNSPPVDDIELVCLPRLGLAMSVALACALGALALTAAASCWCVARRRRSGPVGATSGRPRAPGRPRGPLPHPADFPNPLMGAGSRSCSTTTLRELIYGP